MPAFHHELKCWSAPFLEIRAGRKRHEIRRTDDRQFEVGQRLLLREYLPDTNQYTGRTELVEITYISEPATWGLPNDLAVLSIKRYP